MNCAIIQEYGFDKLNQKYRYGVDLTSRHFVLTARENLGRGSRESLVKISVDLSSEINWIHKQENLIIITISISVHT